MIKINSSLYGYSKYFKFLIYLLNLRKLPSSIIVNGPEGIGKKTFLTHFLISAEKSNLFKENYSIKNIDLIKFYENKFFNIKVLESKDSIIGIEDIRDLKNYLKQSSLGDKARFVLISNIENLNINATNALLKLLENPPYNTYLFLLKNSEFKIPDTILSRCFKMNIEFSTKTKKEILNNLINDYNFSDFTNHTIFDYHDTPGMIIRRIEYLKENNIENEELIKIIYFCLNDFKLNKNFQSLKYSGHFAKIFFFSNMKKNFIFYGNLYNSFKKLFNGIVMYNADVMPLINIFKKLSK